MKPHQINDSMMIRLLFATLFVSVLLMGCAASGGPGVAGTNDDGRPAGSISDDMNYLQNLADYLVRVPGVSVVGNGDNVSVIVRGVGTINASTQPLFVVDGHIVGDSYAQANSMVTPRDIDYVRVLKGNEAAMYGVRGANGVVLIRTRK